MLRTVNLVILYFLPVFPCSAPLPMVVRTGYTTKVTHMVYIHEFRQLRDRDLIRGWR
jgi:hypothetical protein